MFFGSIASIRARRSVAAFVLIVLIGLCLAVVPYRRPAPPLAYRLQPGTRLTYTVDYTGTANSDIRPLFTDQNSAPTGTDLVTDLRFHWHGDLILTVLDRTAEGYRLVYRWTGDTVTANINGKDQPSLATALQQGLDREILASVDPRGRIVAVRFDPTLDSTVQGAGRALLALTQCVLPASAKASATSWETQEEDPNGTAVARYTPVGTPLWTNPRLASLRKTLLRYLPSPEPPVAGEIPVERVVRTDGDRTIHFDADQGQMESQQIQETQTTRIAGKVIATAQTRLDLQLERRATVPAEEMAALRAQSEERQQHVPAMALSAQPTKAKQQAAVQRSVLGNATVYQLFAALERAEREASRTADTTPLYLQFKALVSVHPEACAVLGQKLSVVPPEGLTMRLLAAVLDAVGSPEAQRALVAAIKTRPDDWPALQRLIPPLGAALTPTPEAQAVLEDLAAHAPQPAIASTAQLALGSMAYHLAHSAPDRAVSIVDTATARLAQAQTPVLVTRLLLTLGNAGSPRSVPILLPYLASGDTQVRATAAYALRWLDTPQVETKLETLLTSDPEPRVRTQAANSLHFHPKTAALFALEKRVYLADTDAHVRMVLLTDLWQAHRQYPEARLLVAQAAKDDQDENIRRAAASMLQTDHTP